jgi:hypothetical protein
MYGGVLALALVLGLALGVGLLGRGVEYLKAQGFTGQAFVAVTVGLIVVMVEWVASWPWWVWLAIVALFIASRITAQLQEANQRLRRLERRVAALTKIVKPRTVQKDDFDFDDWDET